MKKKIQERRVESWILLCGRADDESEEFHFCWAARHQLHSYLVARIIRCKHNDRENDYKARQLDSQQSDLFSIQKQEKRNSETLRQVFFFRMAQFRPSPILLAFSRLHEWLPYPNGMTGNLDGFVSTLKHAGIQRVAFLRHGKTAPAENGIDFERQLTDVGREQAREAGASFGKEQRPFFPTILVSPAPRTMETAKLFCEAAEASEFQFSCPSVLYDGTMQPEGSKLFRKIGYAPLKCYLDAEDKEDRETAQMVLGEYAHNVAQVMMESVESTPQKEIWEDDTTLWMVGHAIYLPAAALGVASLLHCSEFGKDVILSTNTVEAEGYILDISDSSVSYLTRPSN